MQKGGNIHKKPGITIPREMLNGYRKINLLMPTGHLELLKKKVKGFQDSKMDINYPN